MGGIGDVTWRALDSPPILAALVLLIVLLVVKPLIDLAHAARWRRKHPDKPLPEAAGGRDLLVNGAAWGLSCLLAWFRLDPRTRAGWGETFILGTVAWGLATGGYEGMKNGAQAAGVNVGAAVQGLWRALGLPTARAGPP